MILNHPILESSGKKQPSEPHPQVSVPSGFLVHCFQSSFFATGFSLTKSNRDSLNPKIAKICKTIALKIMIYYREHVCMISFQIS